MNDLIGSAIALSAEMELIVRRAWPRKHSGPGNRSRVPDGAVTGGMSVSRNMMSP